MAARLDAVESPSESFESLRLDAIARKVAADLEQLADDARVSIVVAASNPIRTIGNARWLEQVIANLLTNAIRHSPPGGRVDVTIALDGEQSVCRVTDQGPGVSQEDRERIFERFVQRGEQRGDVGLGLYICRRIVDLHHGRTWVEANPGGGAIFAFCIPQACLLPPVR